MGIPKFFRYISERWPLTSQEVEAPEMIEFDNLYLDMNSILHNCTHFNDGTISHLTEEQMFGAIFAYIDHLFNTIKPQKVFYMAIDGVAPRAKMNQQRARRFRTAVENEEILKKAVANGDPIPKEPAFDSNAITPGTVFMARVTENLKYYINQKVSTDSNWQKVKVILSGHEVPGEGEHKIMEYIRVQRAQPGYDINTRHCVYGLDADLIMLGLCSHEPHFAILREEVTFGRHQEHSQDLTKQKFFLLHISLVREYLELEFRDLADTINFDYDFDRVLDDFILIMYVIGNDFLPNLPDLHLNKGAFPLLLETFKESMRRTDGYLNENGTINLERLRVWLDMLSIFELENFEQGSVDIEWFNSQLDNISQRGVKKRAKEGKDLILKRQKTITAIIKRWLLPYYTKDQPFNVQEWLDDDSKVPELALDREFFNSERNVKFIKSLAFDCGLIIVHSKSKDTYTAKIDIDGIDPQQTVEEFNERCDIERQQLRHYENGIVVEGEDELDNEKDIYDKKFVNWKNQYYKSKLGFTLDDTKEITDLTENYVEGLQWVLYYYYQGCCSWPWYYRYHYAPRISDVARGLKVKIDFQKGKPFKPFQQLMGVLPARSRPLIPTCYRELMTDEKSPIIDFYPADCPIDMNGKKNSWEAVILLPFIDEKRLVEAMEPYDKKLNPEEVKRNSFGDDLIYTFNPQVKTVIKSPLPEWLPDYQSHCVETVYNLPSMDGLKWVQGLCPGALLGTHALAGFPTLKSIPFTAKLEYAQLVVFQQPSRSVSMILSLQNVYAGLSAEQFAQDHIGSIVYSHYPYLRESRVVYVTDGNKKYERVKSANGYKVIGSPLENYEKSDYEKNRRELTYQMRTKHGLHFAPESQQIDVDTSDEQLNTIVEEKKHKKQREPTINTLVYVRRVVGVAPTKEGGSVKMLSPDLECYPVQFIVEDVLHKDSRFAESPGVPIEEAFPLGTDLLFLGSFSYGSPAKVVGYSDGQLVLTVTHIGRGKEPNFGTARARYEKHAMKYHESYQVCRMLHIPGFFLSKITSGYLVYGPNGRKEDLGLGMKFEGRQLKVLGYTQKQNDKWEYSDLAIATINEYLKKFPEVISALKAHKGHAIPNASDVFRGVPEDILKKKLKELQDYLKAKRQSFVKVSLSSESLTKFGVGTVEKEAIKYTKMGLSVEKRGIKGIPRTAVFDPSRKFMLLQKQFFDLGDRVIYALDSGKVSLFSKGTVVGIRSYDSKVLLQVVFDQPVLTGNTFDGRLETARGLTVDSSTVLNLTDRQFVYQGEKGAKKPKSKAKKPKAKGPTKEQIEAKQKEHAAQKKEQKKELLGVIKGKKDDAKTEAATTEAAPATATAPATVQTLGGLQPKGKAVHSVFASVMGNVMAAGVPQQPQGMPLPPPGFLGPNGYPGNGYPPNGVPPPGPFQYSQPVQAPAGIGASNETSQTPKGPSRGRGGNRGRGGRNRGGRGKN